LSFEILDGQRLRNADSNLFQELDHIIVSIDFLKNQIEKCQIADIEWDLLVIDESHYLRNKDSQRFKGVKKLFYSAYFKMLLTATPIQNKDLDIFVQLSLIDESIKTLTEKGVEDLDFESLRERNIIRRLRSGIKEFERIIPQRLVHPSNYIPLDESLRELYREFKQFITQDCAYYPLIQELVSGFGHIVPFIQFVYLQQLCSSMEAFTASVRRLKDTIGEIIDRGSVGINIQKYQRDFDGTDEAFNEFLEQYGEEQLERRGSKLYLKVKLSDEQINNLRPDLAFLEEILREAESIESIPKRSEFLTLCKDIVARGEKAVVFVKYEPTGKQLTELVSQITQPVPAGAEPLRERKIQTAFFHGGLSKNERRELKNRLNSFTRDDKIDILIATDAGGVGLNLQGANNIINYDSA